jgi:hypothetical protein
MLKYHQMNTLPGSPERVLRAAIDQITPLLAQEERYGGYPIDSIGSVACCVAVLDSPNHGIAFASGAIDLTGVGEQGQFGAWRKLAGIGAGDALQRARKSAGFVKSGDTYSLLPNVDPASVNLTHLPELVKLGDNGVTPIAHELIPVKQPDDKNAVYRTRFAAKLYEAGDATAVDLAIHTAGQALQYALAKQPDSIRPEGASASAILFNMLANTLSPSINELEKDLAQTDVALWGLAIDALSRQRPSDAERVRPWIRSVLYGALVDAEFYRTGNDPDGTHRETIDTALQVYADDLGSEMLRITDRLVEAGDEEMTEEYRRWFLEHDPELNTEAIPANSLVALIKGGSSDAKERLLSIVKHSQNPHRYVTPLVEAGMIEEGMALAKRIYAQSPTRLNALGILNTEFSIPLWADMVRQPMDFLHDGDPGIFYRTKDIMMLAQYVTGRRDLPLA